MRFSLYTGELSSSFEQYDKMKLDDALEKTICYITIVISFGYTQSQFKIHF